MREKPELVESHLAVIAGRVCRTIELQWGNIVRSVTVPAGHSLSDMFAADLRVYDKVTGEVDRVVAASVQAELGVLDRSARSDLAAHLGCGRSPTELYTALIDDASTYAHIDQPAERYWRQLADRQHA